MLVLVAATRLVADSRARQTPHERVAEKAQKYGEKETKPWELRGRKKRNGSVRNAFNSVGIIEKGVGIVFQDLLSRLNAAQEGCVGLQSGFDLARDSFL